MRIARDRIIGALLIAFALAYAALASGYVVTFVADPLGPRAAPFLLAALLVVLGAWILLRPSPAGDDAVAHPPSRNTVPAIAAFLMFAALLPWAGFVLATALLCAALAKLAAGPPLRGFVVGAAFAGTLYYVFVFALDVPLPVGRLFPFLGG